jgi:secreted PhoX family phosphatase
MAGGGTTTLEVSATGEVRHVAPSLNGTQMNCAGGRTPWGSWISCEETVNGPDVGNDFTGQDNTLLTKPHGYLFEVPVDRPASHQPIRAAGRFAHEAVAVDPHSGVLYLTEDNFGFPSGFYRYRPPVDPRRADQVADGGVLEMLAIRDRPNVDLSVGQAPGATYRVEWVTIDDPDPTFTGTPTNDEAIQAVGNQGRAGGGALFSRLEGATAKDGRIFFVSTQGGATAPGDEPPSGFGDGRGQVWALNPRTSRLELVYESPSAATLDLPDNVTAGRWGSLLLCEDGAADNFLRGLSARGELFDVALNRIPGQESEEFAGATFSPRYRTLFVNIQASRGLTFAIRGPWHRGGF